jgi:hypothetical protein
MDIICVCLHSSLFFCDTHKSRRYQSSFLLIIVPKFCSHGSRLFIWFFLFCFLTLECDFFFTNVDVGTVMQFFKLTTILNVDYLSICKLLF